MTASLLADIQRSRLRVTARARVLFADTDKLGVVYHASYLRYLEHARVEFVPRDRARRPRRSSRAASVCRSPSSP